MSENNDDNLGELENLGQEKVVIEEKVKVRKPSLYKVVLLNDDYTTMEFVVHVLERIFQKNLTEATQIMLHVHKKGIGLAGTYPKEIAETKVENVHRRAREKEFPLKCMMEKKDD